MDGSVGSTLLGRDMPIEVFLPPAGATAGAPMPVLFLFHGRGADERQWFAGNDGDGVGIDQVAHDLMTRGRIGPLAIVSASIDDSYGLDSSPAADGYAHGPYERFILEELIPTAEARYRVGGSRASRSIGGLSMGGFVALHLAYERPDLFGRVGAASPALFVAPPSDRAWIYGPADDPLRLVERASPLPTTFLGFGDGDYDWIRAGTEHLARELAARGSPTSPTVVRGGHEVGTWRQLAGPMLEALFRRPG